MVDGHIDQTSNNNSGFIVVESPHGYVVGLAKGLTIKDLVPDDSEV